MVIQSGYFSTYYQDESRLQASSTWYILMAILRPRLFASPFWDGINQILQLSTRKKYRMTTNINVK